MSDRRSPGAGRAERDVGAGRVASAGRVVGAGHAERVVGAGRVASDGRIADADRDASASAAAAGRQAPEAWLCSSNASVRAPGDGCFARSRGGLVAFSAGMG